MSAIDFTDQQLHYIVARLTDRAMFCGDERVRAITDGNSAGAEYWRKEREAATTLIDQIVAALGGRVA